MTEKREIYETPEIEFVEMDEDVVTASNDCPQWVYGNECEAGLNP